MSLIDVWVRRTNGLDCLAKYLRYGKYEGLSRDQVRSLQKNRFRNLVRHAMTHSAFYRTLYAAHGIAISDIPEIEPTDLPIVSKQMLMDDWDATLCCAGPTKEEVFRFVEDPRWFNRRFAHRYTVMHSSGSTGDKGVFICNDRELNLVDVLFARCMSTGSAATLFAKKTAFVGMVDGHYGGYNAARRFRDYQVERLHLCRFYPVSVERPLGEIVASLNRIGPQILIVYDAVIVQLAHEQTAGRLRIAPESIHTIAEGIAEPQQAMCEEAFGVSPRRIYGASESPIIAADTHHEDGMYVFSDWCLLETLDDRDEPTASNEYGRVVLTNLYNRTQPLIRYRMGDIVRVDREPKGRKLPLEVITDIKGREGAFLELEVGGRQISIHHSVVGEFFVPGLRQIQLVRRGPHAVTARISLNVPQETIVDSIRGRLRAVLAKHGVDETVAVDIEVIDDVPTDPVTGKFKLVVDETCTPAAPGR